MSTIADRLNIVADMLADEGFQPRIPAEPAAIQLAAMECRKVAAELEAAPAADAKMEADCWAIMTPNGSKLVSPQEAAGRNDAYPLYTHSAFASIASGLIDAKATIAALQARIAELEAKLNTPELHDFSAAVVLEAAHQRERWGAEHDAGKEPADWFWLLGYLGGKALNAASSGNTDKALHHTISTAAACANWHSAISGKHTQMRPGIDPVARGIEAAPSNPTTQPPVEP